MTRRSSPPGWLGLLFCGLGSVAWMPTVLAADADAGPREVERPGQPRRPGGPARKTFNAEDLLRARPADPQRVLGNQACIKCHASEVRVWQRTPHARTFDELHRRPEARQIAANLNRRSIKHDGRCVACHYTTQASPGRALASPPEAVRSPHVIAGVSCESCHGPARDWIELHHDYGGEQTTRQTESPQHRIQRLQRSIAAGMRNPHNVYLIAQSCYRCHTTADEELVNVGGHSPGSPDFEFVAWSQGTVRHNFVRTDGKVNEPETPQRTRVMFVAGMIADLEASLRATAVATRKATFGIRAAQRSARAAARLKSVAEKVDNVYVDAVLQVFATAPLKLNQGDALSEAADKIAKLGYLFAAKTDGDSLAPLDAFVPPESVWK